MNDSLLQNETKMKIFNTAEKLFYEKGYTNASVDEIIELSGTSKGTFYYYYEHKAELALDILADSYQQHSKVYSMFPDASDLVLISLDIRVFWHVYYKDEGFRRFYHDISYQSLEYESYSIVKTCMDNTRKRFSKIERDLILVSIQGMRQKISLQVYDKLQMYPCQKVAEFSMRQIFRLFEIQNKIIKDTMEESARLFKKLEVEVDKFRFYPKLIDENLQD